MGQDVIINLASKALMLVLTASMPPIAVAVILGVAVALFQALTQIQDQSLPYAIKLVATVLVLIYAMNMIFTDFLNYTIFSFQNFPILVRPSG
ncbi:MAG: EscS/YscS/HrcS family type III secretion system export apparatus protein [Verrucomicrobia bacterium]|nr:MAG: EscS/YscS/HrcS family type III secretion system export apparatus protein [Verrucomicrobiota bacterium]